MAANRTIMLKTDDSPIHEEGRAGAAITPGMNIVLQSDNTYDPGAAGKTNVVRIACEDTLQGRTVDDAYASGEVVFYRTPRPGDRFNLLVLAGQVVVVGSIITSDAAGKHIVGAAGEWEAEEALSPVADALVACRCL